MSGGWLGGLIGGSGPPPRVCMCCVRGLCMRVRVVRGLCMRVRGNAVRGLCMRVRGVPESGVRVCVRACGRGIRCMVPWVSESA